MVLPKPRSNICACANVLSARTKTEEKYISGCLHKALEKRVNKIMRG